jgi:hypothetical protein
MEYDEARGGVAEHLAVLQNRISTAEQEEQAALQKPDAVREGAVRAAQAQLEKVRSDYAEFLEKNPEAKLHLQAGSETVH